MFDNPESSVYKAALSGDRGFEELEKASEIKALVERSPKKNCKKFNFGG